MNKIDLIIDALSVAQNSVWSALNQEALAYAIELKLELAKPEQEPVAWMLPEYGDVLSASQADGTGIYNVPLYTAPPRKLWVGLTDDEVDACFEDHGWSSSAMYYLVANALESKLKEKNGG